MKKSLVWTLCFASIAMVIGYTQGNDCGTLTNSTGTFEAPSDKGLNCTWYIVANNTSPQVMVHFENLVMVNGKLTVFAGNTTNSSVITNVTKHTGPLTLISPTNVTKIVFTQGPMSKATFSANYDTKKCQLSVVGTRGIISSPTYLNGTGPVKCIYNISMPTNTDVLVLSFDKFSVPNGSLDVRMDSKTSLTGNSTPDDILGPAGIKNFSMVLNLQKVASKQQFQATYQTADKGCSGVFQAQDKNQNQTLTLPSLNPFPVTCYIQINTKDSGNQVYVQNLGKPGGGADSIVYLDGGSQLAPVIATNNDVFSTYISSGRKMTILADLGTKTVRSDKFLYNQDKFSKYYRFTSAVRSKSIVLNGTLVANRTVWFQLRSSTTKKIKFEVQTSGTKLTTGTMTILDESAVPIFVFSKDTALFPVTTTGNRALVIVNNLSGDQNLNITATAVDTDCNQLYTEQSGTISYASAQTVTPCTLAVSTGNQTTLDLTSVKICKTSTVEIYEGHSKTSRKLATLSGNTAYKTFPQILFSAGNGPRLVIKDSNHTCNNLKLTARYWRQNLTSTCGVLQSVTSGDITSPNYPDRYSLNTQCNWAVPSQNNSLFFLTLNSMGLATNHSLTLKQKNGTKTTILKTFGGKNLTNDILMPNANLSLAFTSVSAGAGLQLEQVGQGFNVTYKILSCGGLLTNLSAKITGPKSGNKSTECIWIIQLPVNGTAKGSVNIVSANLSVNGYKNNSSVVLEVHDGGSLREPVWTGLNLKNKTNKFLSSSNVIMVRYSYRPPGNNTMLMAVQPFSFNLTYTNYTCNSSSVCDGGVCIHQDWWCNGKYECRDGTDEKNCKIVPPQPSPQPQSQSKKGVAGYWVAICLILGIVLGIVIAVVLPRVVRRMKQRNYQPNSSYGTLHEDA